MLTSTEAPRLASLRFAIVAFRSVSVVCSRSTDFSTLVSTAFTWSIVPGSLVFTVPVASVRLDRVWSICGLPSGRRRGRRSRLRRRGRRSWRTSRRRVDLSLSLGDGVGGGVGGLLERLDRLLELRVAEAGQGRGSWV